MQRPSQTVSMPTLRVGPSIHDEVRDAVEAAVATIWLSGAPSPKQGTEAGPPALPTQNDRRRARYEWASSELLARTPPRDPTDATVAEVLNLDERTIGRWRKGGAI